MRGGEPLDISERYGRIEIQPPATPIRLVESDYIIRRFAGAPLTLSADGYGALVLSLARTGISDGSAYDALVAATAAEAGAPLVSRDRRAASTYDRLGVRYEVVA